MIYKEKEFIAKNGKKLIIKTPEKEDALELVEAMIKITTESSNFLVDTPGVFYSFKENLDKEEEFSDMLPPLIEVGASRSRILLNPVSTS